MSYVINKNGVLPTLSIYTDYSSIELVEESLKLPIPSDIKLNVIKSNDATLLSNFLDKYGELFNYFVSENNGEIIAEVGVEQNTVGKVKLFGDLLTHIKTLEIPDTDVVVSYLLKIGKIPSIPLAPQVKRAITAKILKLIVDIVDDYNMYFTTLSSSKIDDIMNNVLQQAIYSTALAPINLMQGQVSIDLAIGEIKEISKTSPKALDEKLMSIGNFIDAYQNINNNASGKDDISISAASLKTYFAVLHSYNRLLNSLTSITNMMSLADKVTLLGETKAFVNNTRILNIDSLNKLNLLELLLLFAQRFDNDATLTLSSFIGLSADNAKDPVVSKINATPDLIGLYLYGAAKGFSIKTLSTILMSPVTNFFIEEFKSNRVSLIALPLSFSKFVTDYVNLAKNRLKELIRGGEDTAKINVDEIVDKGHFEVLDDLKIKGKDKIVQLLQKILSIKNLSTSTVTYNGYTYAQIYQGLLTLAKKADLFKDLGRVVALNKGLNTLLVDWIKHKKTIDSTTEQSFLMYSPLFDVPHIRAYLKLFNAVEGIMKLFPRFNLTMKYLNKRADNGRQVTKLIHKAIIDQTLQKIKFTFPAITYSKEQKLSAPITTYLDSSIAREMFIYFMENRVIPALKKGRLTLGNTVVSQKLKNNIFISSLGTDLRRNTYDFNITTTETVPINTMPYNDVQRDILANYIAAYKDIADLTFSYRNGSKRVEVPLKNLFTIYAFISLDFRLANNSLNKIVESIEDNTSELQKLRDVESDMSLDLLMQDSEILMLLAPLGSPYYSTEDFIWGKVLDRYMYLESNKHREKMEKLMEQYNPEEYAIIQLEKQDAMDFYDEDIDTVGRILKNTQYNVASVSTPNIVTVNTDLGIVKIGLDSITPKHRTFNIEGAIGSDTADKIKENMLKYLDGLLEIKGKLPIENIMIQAIVNDAINGCK